MSAPFETKEKDIALDIYDGKSPYQVLTMIRASLGAFLAFGVTPLAVMRNVYGAQKCLNKWENKWGDQETLMCLDMITYYLNANIKHPELIMLHNQATIALGLNEKLIEYEGVGNGRQISS